MEYICNDCPRNCHVLRGANKAAGFCKSPSHATVMRAAPHYGEEPCISGSHGAGTIFFSGCSLRCVFCQNQEISRSSVGKQLSVYELRSLMLRLRDMGVHNIDLVTPSHYSRILAEALSGLDLGIPVVWNSSGYESVDTIRMMNGLVQIYMPDFKFWNSETALRYASAADYPFIAAKAIHEMYHQRGSFILGKDGLLQSGVMIRHLILPGHIEESRNIIDFVADEFPEGSILFSLMSQYTPIPGLSQYPELSRCINEEESLSVLHYMRSRRITTGYWQELSSSGMEMIPEFDGSGLDFLNDMKDNINDNNIFR